MEGFTARKGLDVWIYNLSGPAKIELISDFILQGFQHEYGSNRGVRSSTILNTLMGIRHFFLADGRTFPCDHPQVRMLLKGVSRLDIPPSRKTPVSIQLLESCFALLDMTASSDQALWGVLCLSFFFLLRRSEITAVDNNRFRWFVLRASDIAVLDQNGEATMSALAANSVHIRLRGSKTGQEGQATSRMLRRSGHRYLCPVLGAILLLKTRTSLPPSMPAATYATQSGAVEAVAARRVASVIQRAARRIGANPQAYSTHSLRSGGATHMYRSGVDALTIQFHGRWASDAYKTYTRLCRESVSTIASKVVSGVKSATTL